MPSFSYVSINLYKNIKIQLHNIGRISNNDTPPRHSLGLMNAECSSCHARLFIQERTSRSSLRNPTFNLCCQEGTVELPQLNPTPPEISQLLHGTDAAAIHFRTNIRAYNNALSFTSLGVNIDETVANSRGGAYNFRIHGNVYHRILDLYYLLKTIDQPLHKFMYMIQQLKQQIDELFQTHSLIIIHLKHCKHLCTA